MDPNAVKLLAAIEQAVSRMDDWAYGLALRFDVPDRAPAEARMLRGGHFAISCSFAVDRARGRRLIFAIELVWQGTGWYLDACTEEEEDRGGIFRIAVPPIPVASIDALVPALDQALAALDASLARQEVAAAFASARRKP